MHNEHNMHLRDGFRRLTLSMHLITFVRYNEGQAYQEFAIIFYFSRCGDFIVAVIHVSVYFARKQLNGFTS
jgi:hypothetical protein